MPNCLFCLNHYSNGSNEVLTSCAMEKRGLSSANRLAAVDRYSDRSLMYIKNNSGPSMEPWDKPASVLTQGEACPFF